MKTREDVPCNKCGESCRRYIAPGDADLYGLIRCTAYGGYLSSNDASGLSDMTSYTFSLCERCLRELFNSFKVPVDEKEVWP